jgi:hypothetical protein
MSLGNLDRRLDKLEAALDLARGCPECGHAPGGPVTFIINTEHDPNFEPKNCGTCRFPLSFTMYLGAVEFDGVDGDHVDVDGD